MHYAKEYVSHVITGQDMKPFSASSPNQQFQPNQQQPLPTQRPHQSQGIFSNNNVNLRTQLAQAPPHFSTNCSTRTSNSLHHPHSLTLRQPKLLLTWTPSFLNLRALHLWLLLLDLFLPKMSQTARPTLLVPFGAHYWSLLLVLGLLPSKLA